MRWFLSSDSVLCSLVQMPLSRFSNCKPAAYPALFNCFKFLSKMQRWTHHELFHQLPKGIWLREIWCLVGNIRVIWTWIETGLDAAELSSANSQSAVQVGGNGWCMILNDGQYKTRGPDITKYVHLVPWESSKHWKGQWHRSISSGHKIQWS